MTDLNPEGLANAAEAVRVNRWVKFTAPDGNTSVAQNDDKGSAMTYPSCRICGLNYSVQVLADECEARHAGGRRMSEHTPTDEEVRRAATAFDFAGQDGGVAFDRWLSAHDRTVKAEALREAAQQMHGAARAHLLVLALRIEGGATE